MALGNYFSRPVGERFAEIAAPNLALQSRARRGAAAAPYVGISSRVPTLQSRSGVFDWSQLQPIRSAQSAISSGLSGALARADLGDAIQRQQAYNQFVIQSAAAEAEAERMRARQVEAVAEGLGRGARVVGEKAYVGERKRKEQLEEDYVRAYADSLLEGNKPDIARMEAWEERSWEPGESTLDAVGVSPLGW